jgi:hypothetical protein
VYERGDFMLLYHGSNVVVENPKIIIGVRGLDFGSGFYTTSNYEQALRFTENVVQRKKEGQRTVSTYEINENEIFSECFCVKFDKADGKWLDFVAKNRTHTYIGEKYDLVIGPVANDTVYNVINLYLNGTYTKSETLRRLKVRKLFDQWTFCTDKSIGFLKFCGTEII